MVNPFGSYTLHTNTPVAIILELRREITRDLRLIGKSIKTVDENAAT